MAIEPPITLSLERSTSPTGCEKPARDRGRLLRRIQDDGEAVGENAVDCVDLGTGGGGKEKKGAEGEGKCEMRNEK
jgi:hypothetical protein